MALDFAFQESRGFPLCSGLFRAMGIEASGRTTIKGHSPLYLQTFKTPTLTRLQIISTSMTLLTANKHARIAFPVSIAVGSGLGCGVKVK
jgi:hypothetical protein